MTTKKKEKDEIFDADEGADVIAPDGEVKHVSSMEEVEKFINDKPPMFPPAKEEPAKAVVHTPAPADAPKPEAGTQQSKKEKEAVEAIQTLLTHPRVLHMKELGRPFIIVSASETYFKEVYDRVRSSEIRKNTWTPADQSFYDNAISYWKQKMAGSN